MLPFFRKLKSAGRFVIHRNGAHVCVASILAINGKPRVSICARFPFTENTGEAWQKLAKQASLAKNRCMIVLAPNEYQLMQVEAPNVPEAEIKQAVRWKLKDMLAYPLEQATVDVLDIPVDPNTPGRSHYMYAVAARNETISAYMEHAEREGTALEVIDIPELAQRNIAGLLEEDGRGVALIAFNEDGGLLTFTSGGELYHARQIEINAFQLAAADEEQRLRNYERLVLELQRSLDNFERQFSHVAVTRLVIGPMPGQAELEAYLRENLYVRVECLNLADVMDLSAVHGLADMAMQAACFYALGAALRAEGAA